MAKRGRPPRDPYKYFVVTIYNEYVLMGKVVSDTVIIHVKGKNGEERHNIVVDYMNRIFGKWEGRMFWVETTKESFERYAPDKDQTVYWLNAGFPKGGSE